MLTKQGKNEGKFEREEAEIENGRGKSVKMSRGPPLFFACYFLKPLKCVWGLPKWTMFTGKNLILRIWSCGKKYYSMWIE